MSTFFLASGGTGGHVFPALRLGEVLKDQGHTCTLVIDDRGQRFVPSIHPFSNLFLMNLKRRSSKYLRWLFYIDLCREVLRFYRLFKSNSPQAVIGFGGYPSFPAVFAAQLRGIPTFLHEQNAVLGRANRFLSYKSKKVCTSFAQTKQLPPRCSTTYTGNLVRKEMKTVVPYAPPKNIFHLLVLGGSQGTRIFSEILPNAILELSEEEQKRLIIRQQCRPEMMEKTQESYVHFQGHIELSPFFQDIAAHYAWAHFVISRSGASTIAELVTTGRPSLLVPYGKSLEGDQLENARFLEKAGGAFCIPESELTPPIIFQVLREVLNIPQQLKEMSEKALTHATSDAAKHLASLL